MSRTRDTEAGNKVTMWVATHPGRFTVAECAEGAGVAVSTASGKLRSMLAIDPDLRLVRRGEYHYHGAPAKPTGPPLKVDDLLRVTGTADGRWLAADENGNQWVLISFKLRMV